ncbi:hypothetical protein [Streptomyces abyssomicinicus]|uniref:hypothetical protein n=1 Tax=Streptomyces abyssomicinicus TaxID=574929 RepID=UPI0012502E0F|nr:hypothetical protein [Streptomyces abyssomicinicus]
MSDGFVAWYRSRTQPDGFSALTEAFRRRGLSLEYPGSGSAVLVNVDGDQVHVSVNTVRERAVTAVGDFHVKWWWPYGADLLCWFSYEPWGGEKQTYYLDNLTREEVCDVERVLLEEVASRPSETIALIIDETGRTAEFDWDAVVRGEPLQAGATPDALMLKRPLLESLATVQRDYEEEDFGAGRTLLRRRDWVDPLGSSRDL